MHANSKQPSTQQLAWGFPTAATSNANRLQLRDQDEHKQYESINHTLFWIQPVMVFSKSTVLDSLESCLLQYNTET